MASSFYFYDLETTGFNPREARIMQFGGQRTDMQLKPIGEPHNLLIRLTNDVVPDPDAVLVTGITPQKTISEGITEAEFLGLFHKDIATPGTIFVGYNSVRFDDEFMRFLHYRNFYDPYQWQWQDDRSRWDLLDVVRMTRALRPDGIKWPFDSSGKPTNGLEQLTSMNGIDHGNAHDALSDVNATIGLAHLLRSKQPKLFDFLLVHKDKKAITSLVLSSASFLYTSGKYSSEFEKTTVVAMFVKHPRRQGVLVYDLRHDPSTFANMTPRELADAWSRRWDDPGLHLPIKSLQYNRCPAVAPLGVLDRVSQKRLQLDMAVIEKNRKILFELSDFKKNVLLALDIMDTQQQARFATKDSNVDSQLYEGFFDDNDRNLFDKFHQIDPQEIADFGANFKDKRLQKLLPLFKARNYLKFLTSEEYEKWELHRQNHLMAGGTSSRLAVYFDKITELKNQPKISKNQQFLLEELQLYGESIMPE